LLIHGRYDRMVPFEVSIAILNHDTAQAAATGRTFEKPAVQTAQVLAFLRVYWAIGLSRATARVGNPISPPSLPHCASGDAFAPKAAIGARAPARRRDPQQLGVSLWQFVREFETSQVNFVLNFTGPAAGIEKVTSPP
jgi:hypothetical protein